MRSMPARFLLVLALILAALSLQAQVAGGPRYALVIGNGDYAELSKLKNPANDARDMAQALRELGFEVKLLVDADLGSMEDAAIRLGNSLAQSADSLGFFFYAGHGVQSGGVNYLIPADARIPGETFLKTKALPAQSVLDILQASRNALNVVVLDACRDNPFSWGRGGSRGLSVVGAQPAGSIVAYATSSGSIAQDGQGRNGVFTAELLKQLRAPGLEIAEVFKRTGKAVQTATGGKQIPAVYNQFFDSAYLSRVPGPAPTVQAPAAGGDFVLVPAGSFAMGHQELEVRLSAFIISTYELTFDEYDEFCRATGRELPGDRGWGRGRRPVVNVSWNDAAEYCNWRSSKEGLRPCYAIGEAGVSCDFGAKGYRLPTEAEWEYAAKGGPASKGLPANAQYAGSPDLESVAWHGGNAGGRTHPVGGKAANALGLFDMSGNVWEWCWDFFDERGYMGPSPATDPTGRAEGSFRLYRGGAWNCEGRGLSSADVGAASPGYAGDDLGFRLVRRP